MSSLRSYGPLAYSDNEFAKQLLYALDDSMWGMKITALEEFADFATLDTEKLFSKVKSHKLSRKDCLNHDASFSSKALITSAHVGGHYANPTNTTVSSVLEFVLSSLAIASNKQYESIPTTRSFYWRESFTPCLSSARRGGDHLWTASSVVTPSTSSLTVPRGRNSTPLKSTTTAIRMTPPTRAIARRSTALRTRRRSSRRSCPERVLLSATLTSPATTPPAQRRMRKSSASKTTSPVRNFNWLPITPLWSPFPVLHLTLAFVTVVGVGGKRGRGRQRTRWFLLR
jgi:hypothetical protein